VAYLLVTEAVGSSGQSRVALINVPSHPQLAVYSVWDGNGTAPARLAILNLSPRNETTPPAESQQVEVTLDLTAYIGAAQKSKASLKRMQSPGLDSKNSSAVTWAGQSYANGTASGEEAVETLQNGMLTVPGSEGVLVFLA
jgi:hypothetical protein